MKRLVFSLVACALAACAGADYEQPAPVEANPAGVSEAVLAERLAAAIGYPTIAMSGVPDHNRETFEDFREFLAETFPRTFSQLNVTDLGHGTLWFTLEGSNADLAPAVFIAHQDVVPVEPGTEAGWTYPAFEGRIADGYVWGRGAIDMKGHLVTLLTAMESLLEEGFAPARTIHIGLGADEEVAGIGASLMANWLQERGRRAWFHLHWPRDPAVVRAPRVLVPRMVAWPRAAVADAPAAVGESVYVLVPPEPAWCRLAAALLNALPFAVAIALTTKRRGKGIDVPRAALAGCPWPAEATFAAAAAGAAEGPAAELAEAGRLADALAERTGAAAHDGPWWEHADARVRDLGRGLDEAACRLAGVPYPGLRALAERARGLRAGAGSASIGA